VAEDAAQIREAIDQTRGDIGETLQAIGQKADLKARGSGTVAAARQAVKGATAGARAKLSEVAGRPGPPTSGAAQPAAPGPAQWPTPAAPPARGTWRRQQLAISIGLATAALVLWARRGRRRPAGPR
jgi:Protein of unknown function (DUF3618)